MQIVDTILWWNEIHGAGGAGGLAACDLTNRMATRAGLCIICLEPMAAMLGAHLIAVSPSFFCFSLSISLSLFKQLVLSRHKSKISYRVTEAQARFCINQVYLSRRFHLI